MAGPHGEDKEAGAADGGRPYLVGLLSISLVCALVVVLTLASSSSWEDRGTPFTSLGPATKKRMTVHEIISSGRLPGRLLQHSDVAFCPNITEPKDPAPVPKGLKMLMFIGTQKTGSTFLHNVLMLHPSFVGAVRRVGPHKDDQVGPQPDPRGGWPFQKELKYFSRWPLPPTEHYLNAFPAWAIGDALSAKRSKRVLVDGSIQYLVTAAAAPRVKAVVPQAKFVIIIRDAAKRTRSDYKMMSWVGDCALNSRMCIKSKNFTEQVLLELRDTQLPLDCYFNSTDSSKSWFDCFRCAFTFIPYHLYQPSSRGACASAESQSSEFRNCSDPFYRFIDHSTYAPQIAWWLHFFPPERFMIIPMEALLDVNRTVEIANDIVKFTGADRSVKFTPEMVANTPGFSQKTATDINNSTKNSSAMPPQEATGLALLKEHFKQPNQDLRELLAVAFPDQQFDF